MNNINEAFLLLVVGMSTVFLILQFIIYMSRLLILAVNKFSPNTNVTEAKSVKSPLSKETGVAETIAPNKIAAITVALNMASEKKVSILKIEKQ